MNGKYIFAKGMVCSYGDLGYISLRVYESIIEISWKSSLLLFLFWWSCQVTNLLMSQQLSCCDMCKIVVWLDQYLLSMSMYFFMRFELWAHKLFVKWVPEQIWPLMADVFLKYFFFKDNVCILRQISTTGHCLAQNWHSALMQSGVCSPESYCWVCPNALSSKEISATSLDIRYL